MITALVVPAVWIDTSTRTCHRLTCKQVPTDPVARGLGAMPANVAQGYSWGATPCEECRPDRVTSTPEPAPAVG